MDKLAWFPFYIDAWETDPLVRAMGPVARSYFLILLIIQWREGHIQESRKTLRRLLVLPCDPARRLPSYAPDAEPSEPEVLFDHEAVLNQVLACFKPDGNGGLINSRLDIIRKHQIAICEAKSRGGKRNKKNKLETHLNDSSIDLDLEKDIDKKDQKLGTARKLARQLPKDFAPTAYHHNLAAELGVDFSSEFTQFKDFHGSKGSTFKDWNLALNTWLRNAKKFNRGAAPQKETLAERNQRAFDQALGRAAQ